MPHLDGEDALVVETVRFPSGEHRLEGELAYAGSASPRGAVVLAGPHPLLGGTMHNNVVQALGDGLAERGAATLRFDYRGAGRSQGPAVDLTDQFVRFWQTSHVAEEASYHLDPAAAVAFLSASLSETPRSVPIWEGEAPAEPGAAARQEPRPPSPAARQEPRPPRRSRCETPLALVGYSYGCSLLPCAGAKDTTPMVLVAPTIGVHDYEAFASLPNPLLVVVSEDDFAVEAAALQRWFGSLRAPKRLIRERLDNHFFRGQERWLVETVHSFLVEHWQ